MALDIRVPEHTGSSPTSRTSRPRRVRLRAGTLYAALERLTGENLVEADREEVVDGRLRRYYRLTPAGGQRLAAEVDRLQANAAVAARRQPSARPRSAAWHERRGGPGAGLRGFCACIRPGTRPGTRTRCSACSWPARAPGSAAPASQTRPTSSAAPCGSGAAPPPLARPICGAPRSPGGICPLAWGLRWGYARRPRDRRQRQPDWRVEHLGPSSS